MSVDFSKILSHPDCEEIISKLVNGIKPKNVNEWLKLKYTGKEQAHLRLSVKLLKEFVESNLDLYSTLKQDMQAVKNGEKQEYQIAASLRNNKTYQERLVELSTNEIDIRKLMNETCFLIRTRIEQYFDKMQENPSNLKPDYGLIKWFEVLLNFVEKYDKIVNKSPDQIVQHNITVQVMDQYVALLQNCIRETLSEIDPDAASLFLEKFNENINALQLPPEFQSQQSQQSIPQEKRLAEAKVLSIATEAISSADTKPNDVQDTEFDFPEIT